MKKNESLIPFLLSIIVIILGYEKDGIIISLGIIMCIISILPYAIQMHDRRNKKS